MRYLSVFSGIEAASVAWSALGWQPVGFAEVDPACCSVLAHHYPGVPNLGDIRSITPERLAELGRIDVVIGGSPCQDLSVAGKRAGIGGARSSLFHEQVRVFHAARTVSGARFLVWENVPGAFSLNQGADFAAVVGALAGCRVPVPRDGWGSEGVALGDHGLVEWAVLDAQWFGLAQRRKRVFAVLDTGNWWDREPLLLERDSLRGNPPARSRAGPGAPARPLCSTDGGIDREDRHTLVADAAPTLGAPAGGSRRYGTDADTAESLIPDVAWALQERDAKGSDSNTKDGHLIPVAFSCKDHGQDAALEVAPTLRGMLEVDGNANGGGQLAVALPFDTAQVTHPENRSNPQPGDPAPTVSEDRPPVVAFAELADPIAANQARTYDRAGKNCRVSNVAYSAALVRRLTPRECERLQGFPDDYTRVPHGTGRAKRPMKDGPRYRALGNSFAVTVVRWLGLRIERAVRAAD